MYKFPPEIESLILARLKEHLGLKQSSNLAEVDLKNLSGSVKALSDYFTKKRDERPDNYFRMRRFIAAYDAYFLPSNLLKMMKPLGELFAHTAMRPGRDGSIRILDLGCGPGTAVLGLLTFLAGAGPLEDESALDITLVDATGEVVDEAELMIRRGWEAYGDAWPGKKITAINLKGIAIDMKRFNDSALSGEKFDLIILSNSIGEISGETGDIALFIKMLAEKRLDLHGSLLIIEPALKETSRKLLMLRDELIRSGAMNVYSPCLTQEKCQALDKNTDWCHEADEWDAPQIVKDIDRLTGFDKNRLNYSCMIFRKDGLSLADIAERDGNSYFRAVSDLLVMKGDKRIYLCGKEGRILAGRLNREASPSNRAFDDLKRGDLVEVTGLKRKGEIFRIDREGNIRIMEVP